MEIDDFNTRPHILKQDPKFVEQLGEARSPLMGGISGAVLTALVQSSSVVTGRRSCWCSRTALQH